MSVNVSFGLLILVGCGWVGDWQSLGEFFFVCGSHVFQRQSRCEPFKDGMLSQGTIGRDAAMQWLLTSTALLHPPCSSGVYLPHRVGMMHECSTADLLTRAA